MHSNTQATPRRGQSGQAAVETALVVPMMVFLVLGTLQLGMLHHARLMTEYAAYRAARSGIVNHGDCDMMKKAALVGLLPTLAPIGGLAGRVDTLDHAWLVHEGYSAVVLGTPQQQQSFYANGPLPLMRVEAVNPRRSDLTRLFNTYGAHMQQREIDWDDIRSPEVIAANLLTIRVTYFYEMRIPFANWQLHSFYMGREYLNGLRGVQFESKRVGGQSATEYLEARGAARDDDHRRIAQVARMGGKYVIPLIATWSMRMQSNLFNRAQNAGGYGLGAECAVDA
jgi:hypothetical protein